MPTGDPEDVFGLAETALGYGVPLDVTSQPGLWGNALQGRGETVVFAGNELRRATNLEHARMLLEANLIELMTSLGRSSIDFYFLNPKAPLEDFQLEGALQTLESARAEGHVRYLGLAALDDVLSAKFTWTFRDAFDVLALRFNADEPDPGGLLQMARERRVGVLTLSPTSGPGYGDCLLVPVSKPEHCSIAAKEAFG